MDWQEDYRRKLTTPEEAVKVVKSGDRVAVGGSVHEPAARTHATAGGWSHAIPGTEATPAVVHDLFTHRAHAVERDRVGKDHNVPRRRRHQSRSSGSR